MKKIALALVLSSLGLALGPLSTDVNAGARKLCRQGLKTHPMAGEYRDLMEQATAEYKAHKKAGRVRATYAKNVAADIQSSMSAIADIDFDVVFRLAADGSNLCTLDLLYPARNCTESCLKKARR